ncbi:MAG TPA: ATP-binding protein [Thermoanaerobaculia bacterium]|nr:ATP-binding protein [Thermoanaerobaculia bacterium]
MTRRSRIRWGVRTRDALFLVLLTAAIVLLTAGVYMAQLVRVTLESAEGEAKLMARQVFALSKEVLSRPGDRPPAAALASAPELGALLAAQVGYSRHVVYTAVTDSGGRVLAGSEAAGLVMPEDPPLLEALVSEGPFGRVRGLWRRDLYEVRTPLELDGRPFGTIRLGVATALLRREVERALTQGAQVGGAALVLALVVGLVLAGLTLRPVRRLRRLLGELREGEEPDLGEPVRFSGELDELATELTAYGRQVRAERLRLLAEKASLEQLAGNLEDPVVVLNRRREVLFANPAAREVLGAPVEEALGRGLADLLPPSHPLVDLVERTAAAGAEVLGFQLTLEADGESLEYLASVFPVPDLEGERVGFVLLLEDLESVRILRSLIRYGARMTSLKRLAAGMVHELKNPLHSLSLHVELLRQVLSEPPERATRSLEVLAREIRRLDRLVEDFRRFSRPEDLEVRPLDVRDLVSEVTELVGPDAAAQGIEIRVQVPEVPLQIDGDAARLRQALLNVVRNAQQAMPSGGRLAVQAALEAPVFARVSVTDTGNGIEPDELEKVFQLYYSTKPDGSGVGLFMVHRIVQEHGGMVSASSKPGEGTAVHFHLPLRGMLRGGPNREA